VDELSRSEEDAYFNQMKVKLMMRNTLQQQGSPLANSPLLQPQQGEPQDMEQLQMQQQYSYKHILAQKIELALQYIHQLNNQPEIRKRYVRDLVRHGVGGLRSYIDEKGMVRYRNVKAKWLVPSPCLENDFSDMVSCGEVQLVYMGDLAPYYRPEQLQKICEKYRGLHGNPNVYIGSGQKGANMLLFKVPVLDFEFYSWNTTYYETQQDEAGNPLRRKADYKEAVKYLHSNTSVLPDGSLDSVPEIEEECKGEAEPKYSPVIRKVVYQCKWIIDTDYMHDYGLKKNMPRRASDWQNTQLSFRLYAPHFHEMMYSSIVERLMPVADSFQQTWKKLQEMKRTLIPYLITLDLDALESAALAKGGKNMTPMELVEFFFESGIIAYRSSGGVTGNPNYKPASIEASGQLMAFAQLYQDLQYSVTLFYQLSGLNEVTADAPNPDMNMQGQTVANQATNNALYLISDADKCLQYTLADDCIQLLQIAVQLLGKIEGYVKALGRDTMTFFSINKDESSMREFGLAIEDIPGSEERQLLYQRMLQADSQGLLDPAVWVKVEYMNNLREAGDYLSYELKKAKDRAFQEQQANIQQQGQLNMQNAQLTAQMQERQLMLQHQMKMEEIAVQLQGQYLIEEMKKNKDINSAEVQADAKKFSSIVQAQAKVATTPKQISI
jgi:hypothetical protein